MHSRKVKTITIPDGTGRKGTYHTTASYSKFLDAYSVIVSGVGTCVLVDRKTAEKLA